MVGRLESARRRWRASDRVTVRQPDRAGVLLRGGRPPLDVPAGHYPLSFERGSGPTLMSYQQGIGAEGGCAARGAGMARARPARAGRDWKARNRLRDGSPDRAPETASFPWTSCFAVAQRPISVAFLLSGGTTADRVSACPDCGHH